MGLEVFYTSPTVAHMPTPQWSFLEKIYLEFTISKAKNSDLECYKN